MSSVAAAASGDVDPGPNDSRGQYCGINMVPSCEDVIDIPVVQLHLGDLRANHTFPNSNSGPRQSECSI